MPIPHQPLTVGSLFAGIGGFDLGFERACFAVKWQVEIDPWARAVLAKHWPHVHRHDDIRTAGAHNLKAVDVLCGGFPCQDISLAGKGAGMGEGTRSGLWTEYARLIRELRPRYVVVENVAALLARGLGRVVGDLAACGYDAEWDCIPAAAVGAPHRRDRLWIVAYPSGVQQWGGREHAGADDARHPSARLLSGPTGGPALLADALHDGREERPVPEGQRRQAVSNATRRSGPGAHVAHAGLQGLPLTEPEGGHPRIFHGTDLGDSIARGGWWAVEPDVGQRTDGLPPRLDGTVDGQTSEGRSVSDVPSVRVRDSAQAHRGEARGSRRIFAAPLLRSGMHGGSVCQRHAIEFGLAQAGHAVPWDDLRIVWGYNETARASHRRESIERLAAEHTDLVRELSRFAPPPCSSCWADGSWEAGLSRVAHGIPKRVDRLRGLGNAIVPQIAEWLAHRIKEAEARRVAA